MKVIKQAERAWNKVYNDVELPTDWAILDRSFSLLPNEVQTVIALTAQQYRQATLDKLELVESIERITPGDRVRADHLNGEHIEIIVQSVDAETGMINGIKGAILPGSTAKIYLVKRPVQPPNPIEHPHIIDRHDGRAWAWNGIDSQYIRIGESVTKDCDDFDDWEPARSVAADE